MSSETYSSDLTPFRTHCVYTCGIALPPPLRLPRVTVAELGPPEDEEGKAGGSGGKAMRSTEFGAVVAGSKVRVEKGANSSHPFRLTGADVQAKIRMDWDFQRLGIGGLDGQFQEIFRRAFASRIYPPEVAKKMGIMHVKGILLYGPPGCGKTLIARKIGQVLNTREPQVVNAGEILDKFVGESEANVRRLFEPAEKEYAEEGDDSELHMIIFDEFDAICKQRGSTSGGTGTLDGVVNMILSKMDGVDELNNILVIGMTNRKDIIDSALLRPGRFEVQIEIGLPTQEGREQILEIHTAKMKEAGYVGEERKREGRDERENEREERTQGETQRRVVNSN